MRQRELSKENYVTLKELSYEIWNILGIDIRFKIFTENWRDKYRDQKYWYMFEKTGSLISNQDGRIFYKTAQCYKQTFYSTTNGEAATVVPD